LSHGGVRKDKRIEKKALEGLLAFCMEMNTAISPRPSPSLGLVYLGSPAILLFGRTRGFASLRCRNFAFSSMIIIIAVIMYLSRLQIHISLFSVFTYNYTE